MNHKSEIFLNGLFFFFGMQDIKGDVLIFCQDQTGSRHIQARIDIESTLVVPPSLPHANNTTNGPIEPSAGGAFPS